MRVLIVLALLLTGCTEQARLEGDIAQVMKDPGSVKFGELRTIRGVTCGEMNAKNGFGAYTGMTPFMVKDGGLYVASNAAQRMDVCCPMHQLTEVRDSLRQTFEQCQATLPEPIPLG